MSDASSTRFFVGGRVIREKEQIREGKTCFRTLTMMHVHQKEAFGNWNSVESATAFQAELTIDNRLSLELELRVIKSNLPALRLSNPH